MQVEAKDGRGRGLRGIAEGLMGTGGGALLNVENPITGTN